MTLSALVLLLGCNGGNFEGRDVTDTDGFEENTDEDPPVIAHEPVEGTQSFGVDVPIEATVTDGEGDGVLYVYLHYKNEIDGNSDWHRINMIAAGDVWTGTIQGDDMNGGGIDYYIEAVDRAQNSAFDPEDGADDPYHFRIAE